MSYNIMIVLLHCTLKRMFTTCSSVWVSAYVQMILGRAANIRSLTVLQNWDHEI